jgi:hypothetical protein
MISAWDCRSVFRAETQNEVPPEFRAVYDRLVGINGLPSFGLFTPIVRERARLLSHWSPPRLILVFRDSLALLSLDTRTDLVITYELSRDDFLGFGLAEFLLDAWLTFYHREFPGGRKIHYPTAEKYYYSELARFLIVWSSREDPAAQDLFHTSIAIQGIPAKFSGWLESHPELGVVIEYFFQPAMAPHGPRQESFSNLLFVAASRGIVSLEEHFPGNPRKFGMEMTFLPHARVKSVDWIEPADNKHAVIEISIKGALARSRMHWPVFAGLRPYALRWIRTVNEGAETVVRFKDPEANGPVRVNDQETRSDPEPSVTVDNYHVRWGRN